MTLKEWQKWIPKIGELIIYRHTMKNSQSDEFAIFLGVIDVGTYDIFLQTQMKDKIVTDSWVFPGTMTREQINQLRKEFERD